MRIVILAILMVMLSIPAQANVSLDVSSCTSFCLLSKYSTYLEDLHNTPAFQNILNRIDEFQPSPADTPNFGPTNATYWVRFSLTNPTAKTQVKWLVLHPYVQRAELYAENRNTNLPLTSTGSALALVERPFNNVKPTLQIEVPPDQTVTYFLKIEARVAILKMELWDIAAFAQSESKNQYVYGIWYGLMLVMIFYNLFILTSVKDLSYLYYILYLGGVILNQMGISGHAHYIFPPEIASKSTELFGIFYAFWGVQFVKSFLHTEQNAPRLNQLLSILMVLLALPATLLLLGLYKPTITSLNILGIAIVLTIALGSVSSFYRGYKPARFFLLAWALYLVGILIFMARGLGYLPSNTFTDNSARIGSAIEVILLSIALADRINVMKREKERALKLQLSETQKIVRLNEAFEKFVPHEIIELLGKQDITELKLGDHTQREMSILFSDIRSFTSLSEQMTPEQNFKFINAYLKRMEPIIRENHGFIDKYIGDAIMALFNRSADDAVQAAITMLNTLPLYNFHRKKSGYSPINIGIGINTGKLMLGTIGNEKRMEGTVISDSVNLASRIEGMCKLYGASLLITEDTFFKLENRALYQVRRIDRVMVLGKSDPVTVYEVLDGDPQIIRDKKMQSKRQFEEALALYETSMFLEALAILKIIFKRFPEDQAVRTYINRCETCINGGVEANWNGITRLDHK